MPRAAEGNGKSGMEKQAASHSGWSIPRRLVTWIGKGVLAVYLGIAVVVGAVRMRQSGDDPMHDPGLIGWLAAGRESSATGLFWPYFVITGRPLFNPWTAKDELNRILPALKAASAFNETMREIKAQGGQPSDSQLRNLMRARDAIAAVEPIDEGLLNGVYPEWGTMLKTRLFAGITLVMDPARKDRQAVTAESNRLLREWSEWCDPRAHEIAGRIRKIPGVR